MEDRNIQLAEKNNDLEKRLNEVLADQTAPTAEITALLKKYRAASEDILLRDPTTARSSNVETRLWAAHSRINATYRKKLSKLRKDRPNKDVETRKHMKQYLEFLKDSQRFYREMIQGLNSNFGPIPELQQIARQAANITRSKADVSPDLRHQALLSCHQTLIYLGDLSRYRTTEKLDKDPAWGPAIGYYSLAASLRPSSGLAYHQQSVIAFEEGDHLRATYYLYRSIVVEEPHPNAIANLELEFKRARKAWDTGELRPRPNPQDRNGPRKAMVSWFVRLHSLLYQGYTFPGHDQLETEVMSHLATVIKERPSDGIMLKLCFINFAAQSTAATRFQNSPDHEEFMQAFFFYVRLNLDTFSTLLRTWCEQLADSAGDSTVPANDQDLKSLEPRLTELARHALPALRLYSAWLLTNSQVLVSGLGDETNVALVSRFWITYTGCLSLIAQRFPVQMLPEISYLLEEDVDAIAFKPLESDRSNKLWENASSGVRKPKFSQSSRSDPNVEMLARIRELLVDGLLLAVDDAVPVNFDGLRFSVDSGGQLSAITDQTPEAHLNGQQNHISHEPPILQPSSHAMQNVLPVSAPALSSETEHQEAEMSRMVDDLVGPDDEALRSPVRTTSGFGPLAAPFQPSRTPSSQHVQRLQSVSSLWGESDLVPRSPILDHGNRPYGTPTSTHVRARAVHSRVGSAASISSQSPLHNGGIPSSFVPTPPLSHNAGHIAMDGYEHSGYASGMHSPLLFGAGGGPWSARPRHSLSNHTPPNGQGG